MSKRKNNKKQNIWQIIASIAILTCIMISGYMSQNEGTTNQNNNTENINQAETFDLSKIPEYTSSPYIEINNNIPYFTDKDYTTNSFERYSEWDDLGRSGVAFANVCKETMPKKGEERGDIGSVKNLS